MGRNAIAFFAGLGDGYMKTEEQKRKDARLAAADQREQETHDAQMADVRKKQAGDTAMAAAAAPVQPQIGMPVQSDDEGNAMPELPYNAIATSPGGIQTFPTPDAAQAAATAANNPQAVQGRQIAALQGIDPVRAMTVQKSQLDLANAQMDYTKKLKDEGVFDALSAFRSGDAQGMKDSFNRSGKFKVVGDIALTPEDRNIPGVGNVTTYNAKMTVQGPDGTPVTKTINSQDMSMQLMPFEKSMDLMSKSTKTAQEGKKTDAEVKELGARADYYQAYADERKGKDGSKPDKMDEDDKITLQNANVQVRDAEKSVQSALEKLQPGDDPTKSPAVVNANKMLADAKRAQYVTHVKLGQVSPTQVADRILRTAENPQQVMQSLTELGQFASTKVSDAAATSIQNDPRWKKLVAGTRQPTSPAGKAIATAPAGSVSRSADGSYGAAGGAAAPAVSAPAVAQPAASSGLPLPEAPPSFKRDPQLDAQLLAEDTEMAQGKRMQYSPPVAAYTKQLYDAKVAGQAAARADAARRAVAASRGIPAGSFSPLQQ